MTKKKNDIGIHIQRGEADERECLQLVCVDRSFFVGNDGNCSGAGSGKLYTTGFRSVQIINRRKRHAACRLDQPGASHKKLVMAARIISSDLYGMLPGAVFTAVQETGIAVGTVIAIGSAPIIAGSIEWAVLKKRPRNAWWLATVLALAGCWLLFSDSSNIRIDVAGVCMALGAGASFAGYTLISKVMMKNQSPRATSAVVFMISAIMLIPLLWQSDISWIWTPRGLGTSLYIGLIATCAAYFLFAKGLTGVPASAAVTLSLAEPLTASLLGVFFIGERLSLSSWFGIALMLLGLLVISAMPRKQKTAETAHVT